MHIHMIKPHPFSALDEDLFRLISLKKQPKRRLCESMSDWAEREVALACKKEDGYGASCCKSALKVFRALCDDGHSGFSIGITKAILNRLIDGKPLTPIEDTPDVWIECCGGNIDGSAVYQNSRMSSLFKDVYPDGNEIPCERYYAETIDSMEEISKEEYLRREQSYTAALKAGKSK